MMDDNQNQGAGQAGPEQVEANRVPGGEHIDREMRQWAMFCHLAGLAGFIPVIPGIGAVIAPLILWLLKKEDHPFIDEQGKEALNFQISILIYTLVSVVLICVFIGIALLVAVGIFDIIMIIIAAINANNGQHYRYPLCIRFIK